MTLPADGGSSSAAVGIDAVLVERVRVLRGLVEEVGDDCVRREELSRLVAERVWADYLSLRCELLPLQSYPFSLDRSFDRRREDLEARLDRLCFEARREEVERWRDVAVLRREQRQWFREYCDLRQRLLLLGGSYAPGGAIAPARAGRDGEVLEGRRPPLGWGWERGDDR